jgi:prophage regulatory protein
MNRTGGEERFLRRQEVEALTSLGKVCIYRRVKEGTFPRPVHLGGRRVAWPSWLHPSSAFGIKQLGPRERWRGVPSPPRLSPLTPIAMVPSYSLPRLPGERRASCSPAPLPSQRTLSSVVPVLYGGPSSASWSRRDLRPLRQPVPFAIPFEAGPS